MNSNAKVIDDLNKALQMEISATHQYQLHAHVLDDWGLDRLAAQMRQEMIEETEHSNRFIERIMFLKGEPMIAFDKPPYKAASLETMFKADLTDEEDAIEFYSKAASNAAAVGDIGSRVLFEEIALQEEGHKAWLETQLELIERIGAQNYASMQVSGQTTE